MPSEGHGVPGIPREADDATPVRELTFLVEPDDRWHQIAGRQVSRSAEYDDGVEHAGLSKSG